MRIAESGACVLSLLGLFACSGADGGALGGDGGSSDAVGSSDDSSSSDGSSSDDGGNGGDASGSGVGGSSGGIEAAAAAAPCPDIGGAYAQFAWSGVGCSDINSAAPECIMLAQQLCAFQLVSAPSTGKPAVNGVVILQSDGSFSGAALQVGTRLRTGCAGQWDVASQTLTFDCGGMGSSQTCSVSMTRTGSTC
jgi:hypothetical protein